MSARELFGGSSAYTTYRAQLQVRDLLVGGIPSDQSVIRNWLAARLGVGDVRLEEIFEETVSAMEGSRDFGASSMDEKIDVLMKSPAAPSINGFKRLPSGELAYEGRCLKGALKEWANSAYPGNDWDGKYSTVGGKRIIAPGCAPRKGLMSTLAERVFVDPTLIPLGAKVPARVEERIKHVMTPQGPVSAIGRVEVLEHPLLEISVKVRDNFLSREAWGRIWETGEEIGIGADRGRSDGRFDLLAWDKIR